MKYKVVGYGSLMSHRSLKNTVPNREFVPVIVKGYKRVFNLVSDKNAGGDILNLEQNMKYFFNGIMFEVNEDELRKIKEREDDYNFIETVAYDLKEKKKFSPCFISVDFIVGIDHKKQNPNKSYFVLCREAAYHVSKKFGKLWDETTFLAGGERVADWILRNKDFDSLNSWKGKLR